MTITIKHTHEDGTLVYGTHKGDGVYELIGPRTAYRFRFFPSLGMIGIGQSRDKVANRYRINSAAETLRTAGHEVVVDIDDTIRDRETVLADQAERLDGRRDALEAKAERHANEARALWDYSDRLVEHIPPGQPILVGHHSERGHRRTLERSQNAAFKAVALGRQAEQTAQRAAAVGSNAAHSERPDVTARRVERLEAELRDIDRKVGGHTDKWGSVHGPAASDWLEQLTARRAQITGQLDYDRRTIAAAIEAGTYSLYGPKTVHVGDAVTTGYGWHKVVKVNKVTVSCESGYSWTDKFRYTDIRKVRCSHTAEGE